MTSLTRKKNDLAVRLAKDGPRKMLAIDGGGIRGVISLKILQRVEQILIEHGRDHRRRAVSRNERGRHTKLLYREWKRHIRQGVNCASTSLSVQ